MRAQQPAGELRHDHSERHNARRQHKALRGLAIAAVLLTAVGGQVAFGHFSNAGGGIGGVHIALTDSSPDGGTLGGPGIP